MKTKVLLVDDHPVFRSGLKNILISENDFTIIGEASNGREAIEIVSDIQPDIIIMDVSMPDMDGIEATREIHKHNNQIKILILTMYSDEAYLKAGLAAGASGYVLKQAVDTELVTAIRTVLRGENYIYPTLMPALYKTKLGIKQEDTIDEVELLSQREIEVLKYIALGYTQKEIADEIDVSIKTVETYKARIMEKTGANKRSMLVRFALKHGILSIEDEL
ncbi:response regulator transcription factor [Calidifontibacillus oryziterrae]|uniref:response regulator transcription factor n=1 Tax=Calidifontibacillus oryziterrae TaxID=1191699 RepID=UPI0002FDC50C|nr:response regulator transcription factor [Calidifontibacillus oryziterrae]